VSASRTSTLVAWVDESTPSTSGIGSARYMGSWEVLASGYGLVEAPTVDVDGTLLFSDVLGGGVYRLAADGTVDTVVPKRRGVGGIALHADGGIVCSGRDLVHVRDGATRPVLHVDGILGWNDIGTDRAGRVYAGGLRFAVFDPKAQEIPGELWSLDPDDGPLPVVENVRHANGVAMSPDERMIYVSDTRAQCVITWDRARDMRRDIDVSAHGHPDGMAVDETGAIWLALVSGGIGRFTPEGALDRHLDVPSEMVTSLCFDGPQLYVTTGGHAEQPELRGCVLRTEIDVPGLSPPVARV
jgi:D-xylonolactonase